MTKKDLFRIILKLFGLYSIILVLSSIPTFFFYLYMDYGKEMWITASIVAVSTLIMLILLFKPDVFVNLFKLDKGFDNDLVTSSLVMEMESRKLP